MRFHGLYAFGAVVFKFYVRWKIHNRLSCDFFTYITIYFKKFQYFCEKFVRYFVDHIIKSTESRIYTALVSHDMASGALSGEGQ